MPAHTTVTSVDNLLSTRFAPTQRDTVTRHTTRSGDPIGTRKFAICAALRDSDPAQRAVDAISVSSFILVRARKALKALDEPETWRMFACDASLPPRGEATTVEPCLTLHDVLVHTVVVRSGWDTIAHDVARLSIRVGPSDGACRAGGRGEHSIVRSLRTLASALLAFLVDDTIRRARITTGRVMLERGISFGAIRAGRVGVRVARAVHSHGARLARGLSGARLVRAPRAAVTSNLLRVGREKTFGAIGAGRARVGIARTVLARDTRLARGFSDLQLVLAPVAAHAIGVRVSRRVESFRTGFAATLLVLVSVRAGTARSARSVAVAARRKLALAAVAAVLRDEVAALDVLPGIAGARKRTLPVQHEHEQGGEQAAAAAAAAAGASSHVLGNNNKEKGGKLKGACPTQRQ